MSNYWKGLNRLARNFWWCWDPQATRLFRELDSSEGLLAGNAPVALLEALGEEETLARIQSLEIGSLVSSTLERFEDYLSVGTDWPRDSEGNLPTGPVAYFSAEFGVHESLPIYSGGLGVLAGDHCKSASDLGVPMVAIGLLYREGYFTQSIDSDGWQTASYPISDFEKMAVSAVLNEQGEPVVLSIQGAAAPLHAGTKEILRRDSDTPLADTRPLSCVHRSQRTRLTASAAARYPFCTQPCRRCANRKFLPTH